MAWHASSLPAVVSTVIPPFDFDQDIEHAKFLNKSQQLQENGLGILFFGMNSDANALFSVQKIMSYITSSNLLFGLRK
jgi:hypothetical protein